MKFVTLLLMICLSMTTFAKPNKVKPSKGKTTLKSVVDFNPKKLVARVTNVNKQNKIVEKIELVNSGSSGTYRLIFHEYNVNEFGKIDLKKYKANTKNVKRGMLDYIKYDSKPFTIAANERKTIQFEIDVPKNAVGTKFAHFTVEPVIEINYVESIAQKKASKKSALQMKLNVIGLFVLDIAGSGLKKVDTEYKFDEKFNRHVVIASNIGDHFLMNPVVNILVLDSKNKLVEKLQLTGRNSALNPDEKQIFFTTFTKPYPKGEYSVITSLGGENGLFMYSKKNTFKAEGVVAPVKKVLKKKK